MMIRDYAVLEGVSRILDRLACPQCHAELRLEEGRLQCCACAEVYSIMGDIPDLRPARLREKEELADWSAHWSDENQQSLSQRFFSFYRKAVFARTVEYFINRYFPSSGLFVEAGSGTSETSMRIAKHGGARKLVALDIVRPVLERCHPIMDVRICADIFCLPFRSNSVDGLWNVGVMEHFTHSQIDQILGELHRVLKPGSPIILLWPGVDSIPQRMLRMAEKGINFKRSDAPFRFHPEEISQLRSIKEGHTVLTRNGFRTVQVEYGFRSLMAFKTLVGTKI